MCGEYVTSEANLPEEPTTGEIRLQVTDKETKKIFTTRARVGRTPEALENPEPLTVVQGPHENIKEEWYIEIIETDPDGNRIDIELLDSIIEDLDDEPNVINTRSTELKVLLEYLTRTGKYNSVSEASRSVMLDWIADRHPELLSAYVDRKVEADREGLLTDLRSDK